LFSTAKVQQKGDMGALLIFKELTAADETTPCRQFGFYMYGKYARYRPSVLYVNICKPN